MNKLYILPFDHRGSFIKMFGVTEPLVSSAVATLADYKHIIYEGFLRALATGVRKDAAAILVDEQFGARIHAEARVLKITRILTVEKSGQDEFDFEYGDEFGAHIEAMKPEFVKVLVRYNPGGDKEVNKRQCARLKTLNDFCHAKGYQFLFELLAVPTEAERAASGGNAEAYDRTLRFKVMAASIAELQGAGIEPDIWKVEGLEDVAQMQEVIAAARVGGRDNVGIVVLGRGESEEKVRKWLTVAATIPGVAGFAVGRTVFKQPLADYYERRITREEAAARIAENYKAFVDLFESARR